MPIYILNGKKYDIPEENSGKFLADYPKAQQAELFYLKDRKFAIPIASAESFKTDYPEAQTRTERIEEGQSLKNESLNKIKSEGIIKDKKPLKNAFTKEDAVVKDWTPDSYTKAKNEIKELNKKEEFTADDRRRETELNNQIRLYEETYSIFPILKEAEQKKTFDKTMKGYLGGDYISNIDEKVVNSLTTTSKYNQDQTELSVLDNKLKSLESKFIGYKQLEFSKKGMPEDKSKVLDSVIKEKQDELKYYSEASFDKNTTNKVKNELNELLALKQEYTKAVVDRLNLQIKVNQGYKPKDTTKYEDKVSKATKEANTTFYNDYTKQNAAKKRVQVLKDLEFYKAQAEESLLLNKDDYSVQKEISRLETLLNHYDNQVKYGAFNKAKEVDPFKKELYNSLDLGFSYDVDKNFKTNKMDEKQKEHYSMYKDLIYTKYLEPYYESVKKNDPKLWSEYSQDITDIKNNPTSTTAIEHRMKHVSAALTAHSNAINKDYSNSKMNGDYEKYSKYLTSKNQVNEIDRTIKNIADKFDQGFYSMNREQVLEQVEDLKKQKEQINSQILEAERDPNFKRSIDNMRDLDSKQIMLNDFYQFYMSYPENRQYKDKQKVLKEIQGSGNLAEKVFGYSWQAGNNFYNSAVDMVSSTGELITRAASEGVGLFDVDAGKSLNHAVDNWIDYKENHINMIVNQQPMFNEDGSVSESGIINSVTKGVSDMFVLISGARNYNKVMTPKSKGLLKPDSFYKSYGRKFYEDRGLIMSGTAQQFSSLYEDARKEMDDSDAFQYALSLSSAIGTMELISPNKGWLTFGKSQVKKETKEILKNIVKDPIAFRKELGKMVLGGLKEGGQETAQEFSQELFNLGVNKLLNEETGTDLNTNLTLQAGIEIATVTMAASMLMHYGTGSNLSETNQNLYNSAVLDAADNSIRRKNIFSEIANAQIKGDITKAKADRIIKDIQDAVAIKDNLDEVPEHLKLEYYNKLKDLDRLKNLQLIATPEQKVKLGESIAQTVEDIKAIKRTSQAVYVLDGKIISSKEAYDIVKEQSGKDSKDELSLTVYNDPVLSSKMQDLNVDYNIQQFEKSEEEKKQKETPEKEEIKVTEEDGVIFKLEFIDESGKKTVEPLNDAEIKRLEEISLDELEAHLNDATNSQDKDGIAQFSQLIALKKQMIGIQEEKSKPVKKEIPSEPIIVETEEDIEKKQQQKVLSIRKQKLQRDKKAIDKKVEKLNKKSEEFSKDPAIKKMKKVYENELESIDVLDEEEINIVKGNLDEERIKELEKYIDSYEKFKDFRITKATIGQTIAIENLKKVGLIIDTDIKGNANENKFQEANDLVQLGVRRIFLLDGLLNKSEKNEDKSLEALRKYRKELLSILGEGSRIKKEYDALSKSEKELADYEAEINKVKEEKIPEEKKEEPKKEEQTIKEEPTIVSNEYQGKIIYSTPGTGKTTLAKKDSNVIDSDVLLAKAIKKLSKNTKLSKETKAKLRKLDPNNLEDGWAKVILDIYKEIPSKDNPIDKIYDDVLKEMKLLAADGKTVLTGTARFQKDADIKFEETAEVIAQRNRSKEAKTTENKWRFRQGLVKGSHIPLEGKFIEEVITGKEEQTEEFTKEDIPVQTEEVFIPKPKFFKLKSKQSTETVKNKPKELFDSIHAKAVELHDNKRQSKELRAEDEKFGREYIALAIVQLNQADIITNSEALKMLEIWRNNEGMFIPNKRMDKFIKNNITSFESTGSVPKYKAKREEAKKIFSEIWENMFVLRAINDPIENAKREVELLKKLIKASSLMVESGLSKLTEIIKDLKLSIIGDTSISEQEQQYRIEFIDDNALEIASAINVENDLSIYDEISDSNTDELSIGATGEQKLSFLRKKFRNIISQLKDFGYKQPEKDLLDFIKSKKVELDVAISNEVSFQNYLYSLSSSTDPINKMMSKVFKSLTRDNTISLIAFYGSLNIYQFSKLVQSRKNIYFSVSNANEQFSDLEKTLKNSLNKFEYTSAEGKIFDHKTLNEGMRTLYKEYQKTRNRLTSLEAFEEDLKLLEKLTGIESDIWRQYFVKETGEAHGWVKFKDTNSWKKVQANSYEELLQTVKFLNKNGKIFSSNIRRYADNNYFKKEPNLIWNLFNNEAWKKENGTDLQQYILDFFIGKKGSVTDSNLAKLSNLITKEGDLTMMFTNALGKKQTSFEQDSNLSKTLEDINDPNFDNDFYKNNEIVKNHKEKGTNFNLSKIDGVTNVENESSEVSGKLSPTDVIHLMISKFAINKKEGKYEQFLGQFGDKKQIYLLDGILYENAEQKYKEVYEKASPDDKAFLITPEEIKQQLEILKNDPGKADPILLDFYITATENKVKLEIESLDDFISDFYYNYSINKFFTDQIVFGDYNQYLTVTMLIKRAQSTNSPGMSLPIGIEGGLEKNFSLLVVNDPRMIVNYGLDNDKPLNDDFELPDGLTIISKEHAKKIGVSMGQLFAKEFDFGDLSGSKIIYSNVTNGRRDLIKSNWMVVEDLIKEDYMKGTIYEKIVRIMKENNIDVFTFDSSAKLHSGITMELFPKKESRTTKVPAINKVTDFESFIQRDKESKHIFIQQDLRHTTEPHSAKQPVQMVGNTVMLKNSDKIAKLFFDNQLQEAKNFSQRLSMASEEEIRKIILNELDRDSYQDIYDLIESEISLDSIDIRQFINNVLSSIVTKKALQRRSNRVALIELPQMDVKLKSIRRTKDGVHLLLPECICGIEEVQLGLSKSGDVISLNQGIRYKRKFEDEKSARRFAKQFNDIEEWEIEEENGEWIVPGEVIVITRIPADALHSHTLARASYKAPKEIGNIIITDRITQLIAGADNDGDKRFVETLYKDKNGYNSNKGSKGNINQAILLMKEDYQNVDNYDMLTSPIELKLYKDATKVVRESEGPVMAANDPRGYIDSYKKNTVGNNVISLMANFSTVYNFIKKHKISLKGKMTYYEVPEMVYNNETKTFEETDVVTYHSNFNSDIAFNEDGSIKDFNYVSNHIGNLLNMALDNAKDPEIEFMGLNETTAFMFSYLIVTDNSIVDKETGTEAIKNLAYYFNSPQMKDYIKKMRGLKRSNNKKTEKIIFEELKTKFGEEKTNEIKALHYASRELQDIYNFIKLTREAPKTYLEYLNAVDTYGRIVNNQLRNIDTSNFFIDNGNLSPFVAMAKESLDIAEQHIFNNLIETTLYSKVLYKNLYDDLNAENGYVSEFDKENILKTVKNINLIKSYNDKRTFTEVRDQLINDLDDLRAKYPNNGFLRYIQRIQIGNSEELQINENYRTRTMPEEDLLKAKEDFNKLPKNIQDSFGLYAAYRFNGHSFSTWNGNYSSMFSNEYRIATASNLSNLKNDFTIDQGIIDSMKVLEIRKRLPDGNIRKYINDINYMRNDLLTPNDLEALSEAKSKEEYEKIISSRKINMDIFNKNMDKWFESNPDGKISDYIKFLNNEPNNISYQKTTNQTNEQVIATEKTIRDLAERIADRIGLKVKFENKPYEDYKGKIENGVAIINLAHATLDTPIHEILGHPIIRAIKNRNSITKEYIKNAKFGYELEGLSKTEIDKKIKELEIQSKNQEILYQNLLKELETGRGKEVLDRIKSDYQHKGWTPQSIDSENDLVHDEQAIINFTINNSNYKADFKENTEYGGMYWEFTKNGKEIDFNDFKSVYNSNLNKLNVGEKYSLEEQQEEAIVELLGLMTAEKLDKVKDGKLISLLKRFLKEMKDYMKSLFNQKEVNINSLPDNMTLGDLADLLAYSNSKLILPGNEVIYTTPDNQTFKTYIEASNHISKLFKSYEEININDIKLYDTHHKLKDKNIERIEFIKGSLASSDSPAVPDGYKIFYIDGTHSFEYDYNDEEDFENYNDKERFLQELRSFSTANISSFIFTNKEFEVSKEVIEKYIKINNIEYNPKEVYSRNQGFYSVIGAYSKFDVELLFQNLLNHIEDNKKAGGSFTISALTDNLENPKSNVIKRNFGKNIYFNIFPTSSNIKWAADADVGSGSVSDAYKKIKLDSKSELMGVSYTKYPSYLGIRSIQPNLSSIIDNIKHGHNELGIELTENNFRLKYDKDIPYSLKKLADNINNILDQKYGKISNPEMTYNPINPVQTRENIKENIENIFSEKWHELRTDIIDKNQFPNNKIGDIITYQGSDFKIIEDKNSLWKVESINKKEYVDQALINKKVSVIKEYSKKYQRVLITSKIKKAKFENYKESKSNNAKIDVDLFEDDDVLPFQKIPSEKSLSDQKQDLIPNDIEKYTTFDNINELVNNEDISLEEFKSILEHLKNC